MLQTRPRHSMAAMGLPIRPGVVPEKSGLIGSPMAVPDGSCLGKRERERSTLSSNKREVGSDQRGPPFTSDRPCADLLHQFASLRGTVWTARVGTFVSRGLRKGKALLGVISCVVLRGVITDDHMIFRFD